MFCCGSPSPLVLYSLCVSKLQWYIYVCLPPLAVGFGMALGKLARGGLRSGWKALHAWPAWLRRLS